MVPIRTSKHKLPLHIQEPPAPLLFVRGWCLCLYFFEEIYLQVKQAILLNPLAKLIEPKLTKYLFRTELKANYVSFQFEKLLRVSGPNQRKPASWS